VKGLPSFLRVVGWATLLCVGVGALTLQVIGASQGVTDFCQDYFAARYVLRGASPYLALLTGNGEALCPGLGFYDSHPPFVVLLFLPSGLVSQALAATVWGLVSLTAYLVSGLLLLRELGWRLLRGMALFTLGSLLWTPSLLAIGSHNLGQAVTALLVGAWALERRQRPGWAGALIGAAGLIKLWPLALLANALIWRKWRVALGGTVTLLGGLALGLLALGPAAYAVYLGPVQAAERFGVPAYSNTSLVGDVARLFIGYPADPPMPPLMQGLSVPQAVLLGEGIGGLLLAATLLFLWRLSGRVKPEVGELLSLGLLVTVLLVVFPLTWYWGLVTLILPAATVWLALRQLARPPRWWWGLLALSLVPLLIPSGIVAALPGRLLEYGGAGLAGVANALTWLPTWALLLFAGLQAQLLWWARIPVEHCSPESSAVVEATHPIGE
jgi:alpha-1,2-mannosyltransferase